jgi:hypothetical protein
MIDADLTRLHMRLHIPLHALRSRSGVMLLFRQRRGEADYEAMRHGGPLRGTRMSRRRRGGADYDAVRHGGPLSGVRAAANAAATPSRAFHGNGEVRPTTKFLRHELYMRGLAYCEGSLTLMDCRRYGWRMGRTDIAHTDLLMRRACQPYPSACAECPCATPAGRRPGGRSLRGVAAHELYVRPITGRTANLIRRRGLAPPASFTGASRRTPGTRYPEASEACRGRYQRPPLTARHDRRRVTRGDPHQAVESDSAYLRLRGLL